MRIESLEDWIPEQIGRLDLLGAGIEIINWSKCRAVGNKVITGGGI